MIICYLSQAWALLEELFCPLSTFSMPQFLIFNFCYPNLQIFLIPISANYLEIKILYRFGRDFNNLEIKIVISKIRRMKKYALLFYAFLYALAITTHSIFIDTSYSQYQASLYKKQFQNWTIRMNKIYSSPQQKFFRMNVFIDNSKRIDQHNDKYMNGQTQHLLQINQFADLTLNQFIRMYGGFKHPKISNSVQKSWNERDKLQITQECKGIIENAPNPPEQVDWTQRAVTPPESQGSCGSNWAFISTGALQGLYALRKGKIVRFSQQQLIDCSGHYGSEGCLGGFMDQGFWYMIDNGMTTNELYPYKAVDNKKCNFISSMKIAQIKSCARVPYGNYAKLLSAIVQQPTSVAIDAQHFDFQFYSSGIYNGNCTDDINRGMLLVGYGSQNGTSFWKLKNSLGPTWGTQGYILIKKTEQDGPGKCGIQVGASVPQILM